MNIKNIKRKHTEKNNVVISMRITKSQSAWLRDKDYSPRAIFLEAITDLQKAEAA